ncbi:LacI family DNA-binding transcriptional regulator [Neorhodopirellula pilleata]|uniref:HTH-type transcriptional regulator DegA n=1 Tax=Neorhodopirellula pilleata TaxID=2714738 RepID=A0A5C6APC1_9BACT|nr:LacI family DNA-binding transcriptional regulator [Neorhodopirellula pilleata]TWU01357.1 HTH-type transcriptional regulator DegA [Neorhodopirellula pilleata]
MPAPAHPVTLKNVAEAAGVSVSVASRVLNGKAKTYRISDATETQVRKVAQSMAFQPSQVARSLRTKRSGLIGVVVPDLSNPFFAAIAREVTLAAETDGYSVIVADSRETTERERKLIGELTARQIEGLVVCPVGIDSGHLIEVHQSKLPIVLVDRTFLNCDLMQVTSDHRVGAYHAAALLLAQGHRTIGVLQGLPGTLPNEERLAGLQTAFAEAEVVFDPTLVRGDNFTERSGYESTSDLLKSRPDITALFALSTPNAMGALRAATEIGRRVPDELSIVTFDDSPFADLMQVPLSTVCQDVSKLGVSASKWLIRMLRAKRAYQPALHEIKTTLIDRHSIVPPPRLLSS